MITSKQRAYLRSLANSITPIFQIGKGGINDNLINQLKDALQVRELIKVTILDTSLLDTKQVCADLAEMLDAESVQSIGSKVVLYKQCSEVEKRKITLPR